MRKSFAVAGALLTLSCTSAQEASVHTAAAPPGEPIGEAVDCIRASDIRDTRVRDDWTIDFSLRGGKVFRNTLPNRCTGLAANDRLQYRPTSSQLCSVDTITALTIDNQVATVCGLGKFQQVKLPNRG